MGTQWWPILLALIPLALIWYYFQKHTLSPMQAYLKSIGMDPNWTPPEYLGPPRFVGVAQHTPKGIIVYTSGYDEADIPLMYQGLKARVELARIDEIWGEVRAKLQSDPRLGEKARTRVLALSDTLPIVTIRPSCWWDSGDNQRPGNGFVAGLTFDTRDVSVAVWYESVTDHSRKNWESLLEWEFQNVCFINCGRPDLAS